MTTIWSFPFQRFLSPQLYWNTLLKIIYRWHNIQFIAIVLFRLINDYRFIVFHNKIRYFDILLWNNWNQRQLIGGENVPVVFIAYHSFHYIHLVNIWILTKTRTNTKDIQIIVIHHYRRILLRCSLGKSNWAIVVNRTFRNLFK